MENYEKIYYDYQTEARGLTDIDSLQKQFERLSRWYGSRLKENLPSASDINCLDVPCGYGNFLYFLRNNGYQNIKGFDLDKKQVALANLLKLPAEVGDAFEILENEVDTYDLISSFDFIEHITKDNALRFLNICFARLNQGGQLIIRTPSADGPFGSHDICNDLTHKWGMTANVLYTMLKIQGFSEIKILDERPQPTSIFETFRWLMFFPAKVFADTLCVFLGMRPPKIWSRSMIAVAIKK